MKQFYKDALDAYLAAHTESCDPTTLRAPAEVRTYLENRLKAAFAAGWNAGTESYEQRLTTGELSR